MGVCMNTTTLTIDKKGTRDEKTLNISDLSSKKKKNYLGYNIASANHPISNSNSIRTVETSSLDICSYHNSSNSVMNEDSSVYKSSCSIMKLERNNPIYTHLKLRTKKKQRASLSIN